jgi:hypothetical protein
MKLGFEEAQTPYDSGSQSARFWTERWVGEQVFCPNCGHAHVSRFKANKPVLHLVQRGIRAEEPEGEVRREGRRRRLQDDVGAVG